MSAKPKFATRETIATARMSPGHKRLWRIQDASRRGVAPDPADVRAHAEAIRAILAGADANRALGVAGKRNQGRAEKTATQVDAEELRPVVEVRALIRGERLHKGPAIERVAKARYLSESSLERYYKKHWRTADQLLDWEQSAGRATASLQEHARFLDAFENLLRQKHKR